MSPIDPKATLPKPDRNPPARKINAAPPKRPDQFERERSAYRRLIGALTAFSVILFIGGASYFNQQSLTASRNAEMTFSAMGQAATQAVVLLDETAGAISATEAAARQIEQTATAQYVEVSITQTAAAHQAATQAREFERTSEAFQAQVLQTEQAIASTIEAVPQVTPSP